MGDSTKGREFRCANERIAQLAASPAIAEEVAQVRRETAEMDRSSAVPSADSVRLREALKRNYASVRAVLEDSGVRRAWVMGSVARGDAGPTSDIDLFVEFESTDPSVVMYATGGLMARLAEIVGVPVDVVDRTLGVQSVVNSAWTDRVLLESMCR